MADIETPAAETTPPASSTPAPEETVSVPTNPEEYAEWRMNGTLPEKPSSKPSKREDSATSTVDSEESESSAPVSETGSPQAGRNHEKRIKDLVAKNSRLEAEIESLKAGNKGASVESPPAPAKNGAAQPAVAESPTASDPSKPPKEPEQEDFKTWDEYKAAHRKWQNEVVDWRVNQKFLERDAQQRQQAATQAMQTKLNEAKTRYGDEAEPKILETAKAVFDDKQVAPAIKAALGRSEVLVDALYVMGSDQKELAGFMELAQKDPLEALRKWFTVEALVKEELAKSRGSAGEENAGPARGSDGKFLPERPPARTTKEAPAPTTEVGGNSSPPGDMRDRAAASGNVRAFFQEGNRRDMQRWKGQ